MKLAALALLICSCMSAQSSWHYVPARSTRIIAMEWRKVLESPYSSSMRRELPPDAAATLSAINIIEGIERLILARDEAGDIIALEGAFDPALLKDAAAREGAAVKPYKSAEIIAPAEFEEDDVLMAIVSAHQILLGREQTLMRAIDRAGKSRAVNRSAGFDLWIAAERPSPQVERSEIGWRIGPSLQVFSKLRLANTVAGDFTIRGESGVELNATGDGRNFQTRTEFKHAAELEPHAGRIRAMLESAQPSAAPPVSDGKIRIYGLDEGVREIDLSKPKP
jgi:hypothetical protein